MDLEVNRRATARLSIRPLIQSDKQDLLEIYSDPEVVKHWNMHPVNEMSDVETLVTEANDGMASGKSLTMAVVELSTGKLIGLLLMFNLFESSKRCEIGYALNQRYWGKGYMTEALTEFVHILFQQLGLRRLEADVDPENAGSVGTLLNVGFKREGLLRSRWEFGGQVKDSEIYGLINANLPQ